MAVKITIAKLGEKRRVRVKLSPGSYPAANDSYAVVEEEVEVDEIQECRYRYPAIKQNSAVDGTAPLWFHVEYDWSTATSVGYEPPEPRSLPSSTELHRPSWLVRLWWWLTGPRSVPSARLLKE